MVLLKVYCAPEDRKALIAVEIKASSPTLSLSAPEDPSNPFQLVLTLRIVSSTQPGRSITICTKGTVFKYSSGQLEGLDMLAQGAFTGLINTSNASRNISLGLFRVHPAQTAQSRLPNLKERGLQFITIPGDGSEVRVAHGLPFSRMFKHAEGMKKEDLRHGETYKVGMHKGYIGTMWWCWGDLEGDLKGKKLCAWQEGNEYNDVPRPSDEEIENEGWVLGEDPKTLWFEDRTESGYAEFRIME